MKKHLALIIDDEPDIRELLEITIQRMGIETFSADGVISAKKALQAREYSLCLTDMKLPDGTGLEIIETIAKDYPKLPVALITAFGNMEIAVDALKLGAFDCISKPINLTLLRQLITSTLKLKKKDHSDKQLKTSQKSDIQLIGSSKPMLQLKKHIDKVSRSQAPVYINGESGTGKELVARIIHQKSPRADHPFIAVNCGAIPQELVESEFFGHKKGSFTGAYSDKKGLFEAADGGTLFLDEVADLPLNMQVKLLRAIQEKMVRAVGASEEKNIDIRILSATHQNLPELVDQGRFRQDLFYRINVISLTIPPLRERENDVIELGQALLTRLGGDKPFQLSDEAKQALSTYPFPGNVREFENILERSIAFAEGHIIELMDLQLPQISNPKKERVRDSNLPLDLQLEAVEKEIIIDALDKFNGNKTAAAKSLGVSFRSFRYRLSKLNIERK